MHRVLRWTKFIDFLIHIVTFLYDKTKVQKELSVKCYLWNNNNKENK